MVIGITHGKNSEARKQNVMNIVSSSQNGTLKDKNDTIIIRFIEGPKKL